MKGTFTVLGLIIGAIAGYYVGGKIGISTAGMAMNGAIPVSVVFAIIGLLAGAHIDRSFK